MPIHIQSDLTNLKSWFRTNNLDFHELSNSLLYVICKFTFLWMIFEAKFLNTDPSLKLGERMKIRAEKLQNLPEKLLNAGLADTNTFKDALNYMRDRYFTANGDRTEHFNALEFDECRKCRVISGLLGQEPLASVDAVLLIVNQYRNRLFHGGKNPELPNQLNNFIHANDFLMRSIELPEV